MKKLLVIVLAFFIVAPFANAEAFQEGVNYKVVRQEATAKPQIMEFFSYFCPHCFAFEPIFDDLEADMPNVQFKRVHVAFLGGAMGEEMVRAYAVAEVLQVTKKMTPVFFDAIHIQHISITSRADIRKLFVEHGVSGTEFDNAVNSFVVNGMVAEMNKATKEYHIMGVPTIIVNGKYQVLPGSVQTVNQYVELIKYLVHKKN